jgi:integrase
MERVSCKESRHPSGYASQEIVREALDRLDSKMAIGQSRRDAKRAIREERGRTWSVSTGLIHSFKARSVYQEHTIRFVKWARTTHHILSLAQLDSCANDLATAYLQQQRTSGKSPYTLQAERAALRLFFDNRELASSVAIPRRARTSITRSRGPKEHDRHFQAANWQPLIRFLQAAGLRRNEVRHLRIRDICQGHDGQLLVHVANGKGGRVRDVPVLPGHEADVLAVSAGRDPEARTFERIPRHLDVHSYRREYAQALYLYYAPGRQLPPATGRLSKQDYDEAAAQRVSWALGHNRVSVALDHYLR